MHPRGLLCILVLAAQVPSTEAGAWRLQDLWQPPPKPRPIQVSPLSLKDSDAMRANNVPTAPWRPTEAWWHTTGKKYGRLLVMNDIHVSLSPTGASEMASDLRSMLSSQWEESKRDGKVRTLVLNGDALEFMPTRSQGYGSAFRRDQDLGPPNSPEVISDKLRGMQRDYASFFDALADHLHEGHRLLYVPGNHDRAMLHPTVRRTFTRDLASRIASRLLAQPGFEPGAGKHRRKRLAWARAREIVAGQLELQPWRPLIGDVLITHGNEVDRSNSFSNPFEDYYHPRAKGQAMTTPFGEHLVRTAVHGLGVPLENVDRTLPAAVAVAKATRGNPITIGRALLHLLTRGGGPSTPREKAEARKQLVRDMRRYVREFGVLDRVNALAPKDAQLTEGQLVAILLRRHLLPTKPTLSYFKKTQRALRRVMKLATNLLPAAMRERWWERERSMVDGLIADLGVKTVVVGHDHVFRIDRRLVQDHARGTQRKAGMVDTASWTGKQRGVLVVDFDEKGSKAQLMNYRPRDGFRPLRPNWGLFR